jgi:hypothetical protein
LKTGSRTLVGGNNGAGLCDAFSIPLFFLTEGPITYPTKSMLTLMKLNRFYAVLICAAFFTSLSARNIDREMLAYVQQFESAYNKEDHNALRTTFIAGSVMFSQNTLTGAEAIAAQYSLQFSIK